jgi:hypothetical protein
VVRGLVARVTPILAVCTAALVVALPSGASASSDAAGAESAALKRCKSGVNKKRCRCPKGKKLKRVRGGYRCVKRQSAGQTPQPEPTPQGGTGTGTGTGGGTGTGAPQPASPIRDDAGFSAALANNLLRKYEEGTAGYGRYAYNFFANGQFLYCSYYYAYGSTAESNQVGAWQVLEGYRDATDPNYYGGAIRLSLSDGSVQNIGVEVRGNQGYVFIPQGSPSYWSGGNFSRNPNGQGATGNCSQIQ